MQFRVAVMKNTLFFLLLVAWSTQVSAICSATVTCFGTSTCSCATASSSGAISGVITLNPYPNSATCTWLITTSSTNQINLRFTALVTELSYDYIYVETCTSPASCNTKIGTFTGSLPTIGQYTYTSQTGYMSMRLNSDESNVGFFISSWSLVCPPEPSTSIITTPAPTTSMGVTVTTTPAPATGMACNDGYYGPDGGPCLLCTVGTYKVATGSAPCTACPANSSSPTGSYDASACVCNIGYAGY